MTLAQSIVESQRGEHDTYVFTFLDFSGELDAARDAAQQRLDRRSPKSLSQVS